MEFYENTVEATFNLRDDYHEGEWIILIMDNQAYGAQIGRDCKPTELLDQNDVEKISMQSFPTKAEAQKHGERYVNSQ